MGSGIYEINGKLPCDWGPWWNRHRRYVSPWVAVLDEIEEMALELQGSCGFYEMYASIEGIGCSIFPIECCLVLGCCIKIPAKLHEKKG